jgi:hypothetical protein
MPYLDLLGADPAGETWGVMLFPEDETKRRAFVAHHRLKICAAYQKGTAGPLLPRWFVNSVIDEAATGCIERAELHDRWFKGLVAGELLKSLFAIANTEPKHASWSGATRLVQRGGWSKAYLYQARALFLSVIHLWAVFVWRGLHEADESRGYRAIDDLHMFIAEAMAMLQWGTRFTPDRKKAAPFLNREEVAFWTPPPVWDPPMPAPGWPRDGRLPDARLHPDWIRRVRSAPPKRI